MKVTGKIHSVQSLGAVDGPGLRFVVFMQGCPLRCAYCHNPDTWDFSGGTETSPEELVRRILRFRPYFGETGGVTVTGGEPLQQPEFVAELFRLLHEKGIHTALDTSGAGDIHRAEQVLCHTDLVLADLKFPTEEGYRRYCKGSLMAVEAFLEKVKELRIPLWIRHVVVPGLTDTLENVEAVYQKAKRYPNLEKIEWLPFHTMCLEKYQQMGIPFPLEGTPPMDAEKVKTLTASYAV